MTTLRKLLTSVWLVALAASQVRRHLSRLWADEPVSPRARRFRIVREQRPYSDQGS